MPNTIVLPPQTVNYELLYEKFPELGANRKKLIFQSELRSLANGNATFGLIGFALWRNDAAHQWKTHPESVPTTDTRPPNASDEYPIGPPYVAFGNIEVPLTKHAIKELDKDKTKEFGMFLNFLEKISKDKDLLKESKLEFKSKISSNPHADCDITLVAGGMSQLVETNPSPPADPDEG